MRTITRLPLILLLSNIEPALSAPINLESSISGPEIWVTRANTLNATTGNGQLSNDTGPERRSLFEASSKIPANNAIRRRINTTTVVQYANSTDTNLTDASTTDTNSTDTNSTDTNSTDASTTDTNLTDASTADASLLNNTTTTVSNTTSSSGNLTDSYGTSTTSTDLNSTSLRNTTIGSSFNNDTTSNSTLWVDGTISLNTTVQNATRHSTLNAETAASGTGVLPLELVNNLPSTNVKAYISGLDPQGALVMLGQDGQWIYPTATSSTPQPLSDEVIIPLGGPNDTLPITLPGFMSSARIYIADGPLQFFVVSTPSGPGLVEPAVANPKDPNSDINYGFAEFSWAASSGLFADITAVDFVGLPLGIEIGETSPTNNTFSVLGTLADAAPDLCDRLAAQAKKDGFPWDDLCVYSSTNPSNLVRVLSPSAYLPASFGTYYDQYVASVWSYYATHDLVIDSQTPNYGNVTCRIDNSTASPPLLTCDGDNRGYAAPTTSDIFSCNTGPFALEAADNAVHYAIVPRLCAAFNRATLLIEDGHVQPSVRVEPEKYYGVDGSDGFAGNVYSAFVHELEPGGKGYAFPYDDVTASAGDDQSGLVSSVAPSILRVIIGGT